MALDDSEQFTVNVGPTDLRVQKMMIAYSGTMNTDANRHFLADNFDLGDINPGVSATSEMKTRNPNLILLGYRYLPNCLDWASDWSEITTHENWFAHITGNQTITGRIWSQTTDGKEYLMKPYNTEWQQHHIAKTMAYMTDYPWYDGVFMDDTIYSLSSLFDWYSWNHTYAELEQEMKNNWSQGTVDFIAATQNAMGTRMLMPNAGSWTTQYCQPITHVHCYEHFIHGRTNAWDYPPWKNRQGSSYYYRNQINYLHAQANLGNKIAATSGCTASSPYDKREQTMRYCLAAFLMVCGTDIRNLYFPWMFMGQETFTDILNMYIPMVETNFGQPVQNYTGNIENSALTIYNHPLSGIAPDWYDNGYSSDNTENGTWYPHYYPYAGSVFLREFDNYYVAVNIAPSWHTAYDYTFTSGPIAGETITARTGLFIPK